MPARERGRKRLRASSKVTGRLAALRLDMEEPLNDAIDAAQAPRFIGYGMSLLGSEDEGRAISSLASTACQRLDALYAVWIKMKVVG